MIRLIAVSALYLAHGSKGGGARNEDFCFWMGGGGGGHLSNSILAPLPRHGVTGAGEAGGGTDWD
jgi:hypothetical protein